MDPGNQVLQAKLAECYACSHQPCPESQITGMAEMIWGHTLLQSKNTLHVIGDVVNAMANLPGQRVILLTSAGFLTGTRETDLDLLMDKALHAQVVINTLDAGGLSYVPSRATQGVSLLPDAMAALAAGTGGTFYHNNNDLAAGFRELGAVPDVVYVLGFSMSDTEPDGKYHPLRVRLTGGHHGAVQSRVGYMAPLKDAPPATAPQRAIDREVLAGDTINDLPVSFSLNVRKPGVNVLSQEPALAAIAHVDLSRLNLGMRADRRTQKLTFIPAPVGASGVFVAGQEGQLDVALRESTYRQLAPTGFNMSLTLDAPPGQYTLREVIAEELTGKMTAV